MVHAPPPPPLVGVVDSYCSYSERTTRVTQRHELGSTRCVLLINLSEPIEIIAPDGSRLAVQEGEGFVSGVCDGTSLACSRGRQAGVEVLAPPETLERLFSLPLSELSNQVLSLNDLGCANLSQTLDRLMSSDDERDRFSVLDDFFISTLRDRPVRDEVAASLRRRLLSPSPPPLAQLAKDLGWSHKRLTRRFKQHLGMSPARFLRLARFERFWQSLREQPDVDLAGLAFEAGYYDQPHLTRDVRDFSGLTPGELRSRVLPDGGGFNAL